MISLSFSPRLKQDITDKLESVLAPLDQYDATVVVMEDLEFRVKCRDSNAKSKIEDALQNCLDGDFVGVPLVSMRMPLDDF